MFLPHGCCRMRRPPRSRSSSAARCPAAPRRAGMPPPEPLRDRRRPCGCRGPSSSASSPSCRRRPGCRPRPGCGDCRRHRCCSPLLLGVGTAAAPGLPHDRQADDELAALAVPLRCAPRRRRRASRPAACTSDRPMPSPPCDRSNARSTCENISKMLRQLLGGDADAGVLHATPPRRSACRSAVSQMRPPCSVYLAALLSRLANTWASRTEVGVQVDRLRRQRHRQFVTALLDERAARLDGALMTSASSTRCLRSSILSRVMREMSSRSSISRVICCTCRSITCCGPARLRHRRPVSQAEAPPRRCGSGPAGCAVRGPASPGTRPCGGRPLATVE